jgi:hypothetical protein
MKKVAIIEHFETVEIEGVDTIYVSELTEAQVLTIYSLLNKMELSRIDGNDFSLTKLDDINDVNVDDFDVLICFNLIIGTVTTFEVLETAIVNFNGLLG